MRLKPVSAERKSARKSLAALPRAESAATILGRLAVAEPFTLVAGGRPRLYGLYEDGKTAAGQRPKGGDGMSRRGQFRSSEATAAPAATATAHMEAAGALATMDDAATAAAEP